MLWLSGPVFLLMFFSLPETSPATILLQRARRLRKSLDKSNLKSQSEIDQAHMTAKERAFDALISKCYFAFRNAELTAAIVEPWEINALDPAVLFSTFYSKSSEFSSIVMVLKTSQLPYFTASSTHFLNPPQRSSQNSTTSILANQDFRISLPWLRFW